MVGPRSRWQLGGSPERAVTASGSGALRFARYAYPPNVLGYCGPDAARQLLEQVDAGADDADLRRLLQGFEGAWPYLELIAAANGIADPLDARVVEAYWIGNRLLEAVGISALGSDVEQRFRGRAGRVWSRFAEQFPAGAMPHHSFHVLGVYPWVGLLRGGRVAEPMHVLDRCRIRWGRVEQVSGATALVRSRPLAWDGHILYLGPARTEEVSLGSAGLWSVPGLSPGDWCALHWDWVCDRLDDRSLAALRYYSAGQLALVNSLPHPGPAAVLA